jgi:hypothetical protein
MVSVEAKKWVANHEVARREQVVLTVDQSLQEKDAGGVASKCRQKPIAFGRN